MCEEARDVAALAYSQSFRRQQFVIDDVSAQRRAGATGLNNVLETSRLVYVSAPLLRMGLVPRPPAPIWGRQLATRYGR